MRRYELMLLFRPDLEDDKLQSAVEKVTRAIVNAGGTLTKVSPWGKRRMAYDIQHFREASYFLLHFDIAPSAIREIERGMLISEEILRHLVTVLVDHGTSVDDELAPAAVPADLQDGDLTGIPDEDDDDAAVDAVVAEADEGANGVADLPASDQPAADEVEAVAPEAEEPAAVAETDDGEETEEAGAAVKA
ncbi:MAG TPA: 30S ribosomal protein S6 [Candidatus Limnocylindria bacterium]|nr:30S ribosomal protein S6 [Candidatus Limnocylindria bacterium]